MSFQRIKTPLGEFIGFYSATHVWFSNQVTNFPALLTTPPPPALLEKENPRLDLLKRYPDTAAAVFLNSAHEGASAMALPGFIPVMMSAYGIQHGVLAYSLLDEGVQISAYAPADKLPVWTKSWKPVSTFPFTREDPQGLMELAFQVPMMSAPGCSTFTKRCRTLSSAERQRSERTAESVYPSDVPTGFLSGSQSFRLL